MNRLLPLVLLALACQGGDRRGPALDTDDTDSADVEDTGEDVPDDPGPLGFVGSPCETSSDCEYEGAVCLTDGYGGGMCSQACDLYCPDEAGHPTTFCVDGDALQGEARELGSGACHSRCDFGVFPETGCRPDYGCVVETRANEASTETYVCLPDVQPELSACHHALADMDVSFEPIVFADRHPDDDPSLTCHVQDAVRLRSPVHGVALEYFDGTATPTVMGACEMAISLVDTIDDVKAEGAVAVRHIGTYNCRKIAGSSNLSRHAYADAIDLYGFEMDDGELYTLIDDWEYDTQAPSTVAGSFLYSAAHRWYDAGFWEIILTPNYNSAHANHFHVDLTPGGDFIRDAGRIEGPFEDPFGNTW